MKTAEKKYSMLKNAFKCVLVLGIITVVCVALLALANKFLAVEITLDKATARIINQMAPTGVDDDTAYSEGYVKLVDLSKGGYNYKSVNDYNKKGSNKKVRALYTSQNAESGKLSYIVEAEAKGRDAAIVMLVAYDEDLKIAKVHVKSQAESYWDRIEAKKGLLDEFIGLSGTIESDRIATKTGATSSLGGIVGAVNTANGFIASLKAVETAGGE